MAPCLIEGDVLMLCADSLRRDQSVLVASSLWGGVMPPLIFLIFLKTEREREADRQAGRNRERELEVKNLIFQGL